MPPLPVFGEDVGMQFLGGMAVFLHRTGTVYARIWSNRRILRTSVHLSQKTSIHPRPVDKQDRIMYK